MIAPTGTPGEHHIGVPALHRDEGEVEARFQAYRRRQAARLLHLVPREAVRPLYRRALDSLEPEERPFRGDPLALLTRFCATLLPLPTRAVWEEDLRRHPDAHLRDLEDSVHGPTGEAPATLDARTLESGGRRWDVLLRAFRDKGAWRGLMAFEDRDGSGVFRTATIFREGDLLELRARFRSFEPAALEAFLRSARP